MMFARRQKLFLDDDQNMSPKARHFHARLARDAAREAIGTLTLTARRQYRRYRKQNPDQYLGWEAWVGHYREVTDGPVHGPGSPNDGMNNIPMNP
ncbi:hypothetical protein ASG12_07765 [Williamsia sp. Leaf354]|nr:hypothetical protein ASG12_07765 [Williamsia sp. Leaf354]